MKVEIFIAVSGGVVQDVRAAPKGPNVNHKGEYDCFVVDYDDWDNCYGDPKTEGMSEEEFERSRLDGRTWAEIEEISVPVW